MNTSIALFRAINVGGKNILPMQELRTLLDEIGARDVRTYIQSGNAVFRSDETDPVRLSSAIRTAIRTRFGFEPHVLLLDAEELEHAVADNPFPAAVDRPKTLHVWFLSATPEPSKMAALEAYKSDSERFQLMDRRIYLHAPDGIGRSKLVANAERVLGVPMTARNWTTVCRLLEMATG